MSEYFSLTKISSATNKKMQEWKSGLSITSLMQMRFAVEEISRKCDTLGCIQFSTVESISECLVSRPVIQEMPWQKLCIRGCSTFSYR